MWRSCNSSCNFTPWPPDTEQQYESTHSYPSIANNNGWSSMNASYTFSCLRAHGRSIHLNSSSSHQLNPQSLNPLNGSSGEGVASTKGCQRMGCTTQMKRFLIFDQSGDRTNLIFSSLGNPVQVLKPVLPATNAIYACASDCHEIEDEEMHEDTEEIDALLYSDSENSYDSEEASTGHSPPGMEEDEEALPPIPTKRRKVEHSELGTSVMDTASSSAVVPRAHFVINDGDDDDDDDDVELSYVYSGIKSKEDPGEQVICSKHGRIQATVDLLRRIIPGGKGKKTAAVLDDAIRYLKSLKLQAETLGLHID